MKTTLEEKEVLSTYEERRLLRAKQYLSSALGENFKLSQEHLVIISLMTSQKDGVFSYAVGKILKLIQSGYSLKEIKDSSDEELRELRGIGEFTIKIIRHIL